MAEWRREGANANVFAVLHDDDEDLARLVPEPVVKRNEPMSQHNDDTLPDEVIEALGKMSASDQRAMRKLLEAVSERAETLRKDATSSFLAELRAYLQAELANLAAIPSGDDNPTDITNPRTPQFPAGPKRLAPQASALTPALKQLAQRLLLRAVSQRNNLIVAEQDSRGLVYNPMRDAREKAAAFDMAGEKLTKADPAARTSAADVQQEDFSTNPYASAQAERDRVAAQRRGR